MRGRFLLILVLVSVLAPTAAAAPRDCTGRGITTAYPFGGVRCEESTWGENHTRRTALYASLEVYLPNGRTTGGALIVEHSHTVGPSENARCTAQWQPYGLGPPAVSYGTGCAGVRHPLLP